MILELHDQWANKKNMPPIIYIWPCKKKERKVTQIKLVYNKNRLKI